MTLPPEANMKLMALEGGAGDAQSAAAAAHKKIGELSKLLDMREQDDAEAIKAEIARLETRRADQSERHRVLSNLTASLRDWLKAQRGVVFVSVRAFSPRLLKGEKPEGALARLRAEIDEAVREIVKVRAAPPPRSEIKAALAAKVAAMAAKGAPSISIGPDGVKLAFAEQKDWSSTQSDLLGGLLAWLDAERLTAKLHAEIDNAPEPELALTAKDKTARLTTLNEKIENLSRMEEAVVEEHGLLRRANAHPLAVLGIRPKRREAVAA